MYWIYVPGTVLRYGAITMNNINLPSWNSLLKECPHGICQFYLLSILRNLRTPPRPRVPSDRISCRRCSNSRVGPREGTRVGPEKLATIYFVISLWGQPAWDPCPKGALCAGPWLASLLIRVSFLGRLTVCKKNKSQWFGKFRSHGRRQKWTESPDWWC